MTPLGGAHPDTWRQAEQPGALRLYEADGTAILARDPDEAERLLEDALFRMRERLREYTPRTEERRRSAMDCESPPEGGP